MKACVWNCRGLGGPSTVSQLKEAWRFHLPDILCVCETKKKMAFVKTVCRNLKVGSNWHCVDPSGLSGGMLVCWKESIKVLQVISNSFCVEVECEYSIGLGSLWVVFVYASPDDQTRLGQWDFLVSAKQKWGDNWILGGDFNDIRCHEEKRGGNKRADSSFINFNNFISNMAMVEIPLVSGEFTWTNNRQKENFVEEKLDMFFGSSQWQLSYPTAKVFHNNLTSSDHCLLTLVAAPTTPKLKRRFAFDSRWLEKKDFRAQVERAWNLPVGATLMFQVHSRIRNCRIELLKWNRGGHEIQLQTRVAL
ncbi:hypothetical protein DH2020_035250 [Rehmannia glutinosa]|uniref:Endonuclease/exonuclease/phosphatase domain-containing protein n=1 Tax=Rehmannia glutinosa TaxID=99300 RepID=A0ABR0VAL5_REHGL